MTNMIKQLTAIQESVRDISQRFATLDPARYKGSAFYLPSSERDAVFALNHENTDRASTLRSDKYLAKRRFDAQTSAAAQSLESGKASFEKSVYIPDDHICVNAPVHNGVLQIIFDQKTQLDRSVIRKLQTDAEFKTLSHKLGGLYTTLPDNYDATLNVREAYKPNAVIAHFDLSGFSKASAQHGYYRAEDFADQVMRYLISPIAQKYGAEICRHEGDGIWYALPLEDGTEHIQAQESIAFARDVMREYPIFAKNCDLDFQDLKLKGALELGELQNKNAFERSGPVFTHIRNALKSKAQRDKQDLLIGEELNAYIAPDSQKRFITEPEFQHIDLQ